MLCLITSHELLHIIHAEFRFPEDGDPMTQKYDNLVKGWILSTMSDQVHHMFRIYRSVQLLWRNLESYFTYQPEIECWQGGPSNETEELKCRGASNVNVSNFVSVKLSGLGNYYIWKAQMLCLIERHDLLRLLHGNDDLFEGKYDKLVRDWILSTLDDRLLNDLEHQESVQDLWIKLESLCTDGDTWLEPVVSASTQDRKYIQALNVNLSNFISVKLSGQSNYPIWKIQMLCLINSQKLLHVIFLERVLVYRISMTPLSKVGFLVLRANNYSRI
ncbi:hypothetical protein HanRHA438_Chr00c38g0856551 [Helianthus annuus]|nr:hypothetical protein HanHA300_Chr06g0223381 [Helianthus annuus]KAJ0574539.1 hypothetical protein HanHA89_Chr06g0239271 [Helianthus annuus]KAJ0738871.1 hypothetical protein HanLR1_Chr06g0223181 [Helianthus annuus]KAJ0953920.1 hypothetical protein HanRHA438_Chr00c38g0856551 [Helianthus annuus]